MSGCRHGWGLAAAVSLAAGCASVPLSVAVSSPVAADGDVRLVSVGEPNGEELGAGTVVTDETLEAAIAQLEAQVAELGGDTGVIDSITHAIAIRTVSWDVLYDCGHDQMLAPNRCTRTETEYRAVVTIAIEGRALRTRPGEPAHQDVASRFRAASRPE